MLSGAMWRCKDTAECLLTWPSRQPHVEKFRAARALFHAAAIGASLRGTARLSNFDISMRFRCAKSPGEGSNVGRLGTHFRTQPGHHATAHLVLKHYLNHGAAESVFD